jgi:ribosomal protein L22
MMAERKKTKKDEGTARTEAKREAESKGGAKGRGGSEAAGKTEAKGSASKAKSKPKAPAKRKQPAKKETVSKGKDTAKPKGGAKPKTARKPKEEPQAPVVNARARFVRVAPRKARLVANQVRGLHIEDARTLLRFSPRGAARDISKLIDSAAANAESNHDLIADDLMIADIRVDEGPTLRRYRPRALGRATKIDKRTSHIQVALTPEE